MRTSGAAAGGLLRLACAATFLALPLGARSTARGASQDGPEPVFKALLIDGREVTGRIDSFGDARVAMATGDGKKEGIPFDRLVKLSRDSPVATTAAGTGQAVLLGGGDRLLRAAVGDADETGLQVKSELFGALEVPLECVLGVVLGAPGSPGGLDPWVERVRTEPRTSEVVWLSNGDRLAGTFLSMDDRAIKLQVDAKPVEVDRGGVVALGFDPKLIQYPAPEGAYLEATLSDGTRLGLPSLKLVEGDIEARTRFGRSIRFPVAELARLHARSRSVVYLSEREPARAQYEEYVGPTLPFRVDRAVDGQPMRLGGQAYDHGIGTQSRTLLAYRIQPGDRRFQATIGVDERAGPLGSVVFRMFVDRQERFKSPPMSHRDPPRVLDIDLSGGKILILATEFGDRGNVRDLADWAEARIIR